ncbi:glycosyltransferase [Pedobacter sp. MC2016-24]|uniref:glycosyltransferase n=1 Tax=Pedobacter sp. MC2016-24 TaxID=2780090 RepID=UPI001881A75B|nr:glycosyltransferase [Pedobacter sp. MC2016-24]MBE9600306.1 glycosyltransferase [Pedobacter sp. MC2016-24]
MRERILFLITKSEIGGAQKFVKEQIEISNDHGFDCYLATNEENWLTEEVKGKVVGQLIHSGVSSLSMSYFIRLASFIKEHRIKLVICNSAIAGVYGRLVAAYSQINSIYVSHGWSSVYNGGFFSMIFNRIEWGLSKLTSMIICVSENDMIVARTKIKISAKKLIHISNGIKALDPEKSLCSSNLIQMLAVARLQHPKRIDLLVDALKNRSDVQLTIVGEGEQANLINEKIEANQLKNIKMLGKIDGFKQFVDYDIFALISESEGLPISAIEAMSCSNALLLSNVGGCSELIDGNGVLVDNQVESIAKGIDRCIEDLSNFKKGSLSLFKRNFDLDKNKLKYVSLYRKFSN